MVKFTIIKIIIIFYIILYFFNFTKIIIKYNLSKKYFLKVVMSRHKHCTHEISTCAMLCNNYFYIIIFFFKTHSK
jgi:hypothetical protein